MSYTKWQDKLEDVCRGYNIAAPAFHIVSDRRGGRTAWSSSVTVSGTLYSARFWYDGNNINNAKEDAAEVALQWLNKNSPGTSSGSATSSPSTSRSVW